MNKLVKYCILIMFFYFFVIGGLLYSAPESNTDNSQIVSAKEENKGKTDDIKAKQETKKSSKPQSSVRQSTVKEQENAVKDNKTKEESKVTKESDSDVKAKVRKEQRVKRVEEPTEKKKNKTGKSVAKIRRMGETTYVPGFVTGRKGNYLSSNWIGTSGFFRLSDTRIPPLYTFRLGLNLGYYYMKNFIEDRTHNHIQSRGFLSFTPWQYLEVFLNGFSSAHKVGPDPYGSKPEELLQINGDTIIGAKGAYNIEPYTFMAVGAQIYFDLYTNLENWGIKGRAFSAGIDAIYELNFKKWEKTSIPLFLTVNIGYYIDNSWQLTKTISDKYWSRIVGYGIKEGDQIKFGFGLEYPQEFYSVIFEYTTEQIFYHRHFNQSPQRMTFGGKFNPWDYLTLNAALDLDFFQDEIRYMGMDEEVAPNYQLFFGMDYLYLPEKSSIKDIRGKLKGVIIDEDTGKPVGGAVVEYVNQQDLSKQVVDLTTGQFQSYKFMPGEVLIKVQKEGYSPKVVKAKIESDKIITEKILLSKITKASVPMGAIAGKVVDEKGVPIKAELKFLKTTIPPIDTGKSGKFIKVLPVGVYQILVKSKGYSPKAYKVPVEERKKIVVTFQLSTGPDVGAFAGVISTIEGKPLKGTIKFLDAGIPPINSDSATGEFMKILPPGEYKISVESSGYSVRKFKIPIEPGKKTKVNIKLATIGEIGAFAGKINDETGKPIAGAKIIFSDKRIPVIEPDPANGQFFSKLPAGSYIIEIRAPGYKKKMFRIPVLKGKKTVQDFILKKAAEGSDSGAKDIIVKGNRITFVSGEIKFVPGTNNLKEKSVYFLDKLAVYLSNHSELKKIEIDVYSDNQGPSELNKKMTEKQANVIKQYLINKGINPVRLKIKGLGESNPIADNKTEAGRERNRRVEFIIIK